MDFPKVVEQLNAGGSDFAKTQSDMVDATGLFQKIGAKIKANAQAGKGIAGQVAKKVEAVKQSNAGKALAKPKPVSSEEKPKAEDKPAESTDKAESGTTDQPKEEKGFNWLLWGGVGVAVIGSIIGIVVWKKHQSKGQSKQ